jgi:hydroxyacylglutathione hydrolase
MFVQRFYLDCLSHASYMVADEKTKEAAVIDPQRDIDIYMEEAKQHEFRIKYVILTHFHADFISGHIELRDRAGAEIVMGARAEAEFPFRRLGDGDSIEMGDVRLEGLETPGHTPEGLTVLAFDKVKDNENPYAAFTGDTLFIGDVGRPDLMASIGVTAEELGEMLFDSLHNKLMKLSDETLVYPAHGAGSMCGKSLSNEAVSTIGQQRKYNYALQPMSKEQFMSLVVADQPEAPGYFAHDAILNRKERASLDESMADTMTALSVDAVVQLQKDGAQVVDTRSPVDFAGAHLKGSLNIGIDGKYATWAGTVLKKDAPIVIVADDDRESESIMRLGRIGFDHVAGYLDGGLAALRDRSDLIGQVRRITAPAVPELESKPVIVDVRTAKEWDAGHIDGSLNIPLNQLEQRAAEVPSDGDVVIQCQSGYRSSIATSILQRLGHSNVIDLVGGYKAWVQSGQPTSAPGAVDACQGGSCSA